MIDIISNARQRNKLTITKNKEQVRIKLQQENSEQKNNEVLAFFLRVVDNCPSNETTLRGSILTERLLYGITLYNDSKTKHVQFSSNGSYLL